MLVDIMASTPATTNAAGYARIVEEHALLRRLIGVAGEIAEIGYGMPDDVTKALDRAESMVYEVNQRRVTDTTAKIEDLLGLNLDRLEQLYGRGDAITGVPTGYVDLDELLSGLQPSTLVVVGARPSMGKCVAGDTLDRRPGDRRRCAPRPSCTGRGTAGGDVSVLTLDGGRMVDTRPSAFVDDGVKPVYRVRTRTGREVRTTASHPFLTPDRLAPLADLAPRGAWWGCRPSMPVFGVEGAAGRRGRDAGPPGHGAGRGRGLPQAVDREPRGGGRHRVPRGPLRRRRRRPHAARRGPHVGRDRLARAGRPGPPPRHRRRAGGPAGPGRGVPPAPRAAGPVPQPGAGRRGRRCGGRSTASPAGWWPAPAAWAWRTTCSTCCCASASASRVAQSVVAVDQTTWLAHELVVEQPSTWWRWPPRSAPLGREAELGAVVAHARASATLAHDVIPCERRRGRARAGRRPARAGAGRCAGGGGAGRAPCCGTRSSPSRHEGDEQVYDLTVPGTHNFVAADVFVHNTSFALGMGAHAALHANRPVLLFSLEMGSLELSQRLLCGEARIDSSRVRTGRLSEDDWSRISQAIGRLAAAPIWIDDNPNLTVMEIRAKARRLAARSATWAWSWSTTSSS